MTTTTCLAGKQLAQLRTEWRVGNLVFGALEEPQEIAWCRFVNARLKLFGFPGSKATNKPRNGLSPRDNRLTGVTKFKVMLSHAMAFHNGPARPKAYPPCPCRELVSADRRGRVP